MYKPYIVLAIRSGHEISPSKLQPLCVTLTFVIYCYNMSSAHCLDKVNFDPVILEVSGLFCRFHSIFNGKPCMLANTVDPNQMPHYVASDLGLHCWPMTLLQISPVRMG